VPSATDHGCLSIRANLEVAADSLLRIVAEESYFLLADFLDALQIKHEKGVVEQLPPSVEDAALSSCGRSDDQVFQRDCYYLPARFHQITKLAANLEAMPRTTSPAA